jgi:hypothetical protein
MQPFIAGTPAEQPDEVTLCLKAAYFDMILLYFCHARCKFFASEVKMLLRRPAEWHPIAKFNARNSGRSPGEDLE